MKEILQMNLILSMMKAWMMKTRSGSQKNLRPHVSSRVQNKKESHSSAQHHINSTDTKALGNTTKRARGKKQDCGGTLLSCPACFITLSMDCQQHEKYKNQWRAMFVSNCVTKLDESFEVSDPAPGEVYRPVACAGCGAVVAALEPREEVYHFFNVIPSSH
mmetsp:Transcript_42273/g.72802  ORF Transcript_42273/g.72802 Transcript_42273/m.72802 type:complete len:161 (+) Transcript_42273:78-560(+)